MNDLSVALVQGEPEGGGSFSRLNKVMQSLPEGADLIVLPEVFNADFMQGASSGGKPYSEKLGGASCQWMQQKAQELGAVITGSLIVEKAPGVYVNRLLWVRPDGSFEEYDKCHLFRMGGEHKRYTPGDKKIIVELNGWRICPLVCYDLRFPVFSRNRYNEEHGGYDYDLLLYVANWPCSRRTHWRTLLQARAIENQACVVGVNRIGLDTKGWRYSGDSLAIDARGELQVDMLDAAGFEVCTFSMSALRQYREKFPIYLDADDFELGAG